MAKNISRTAEKKRAAARPPQKRSHRPTPAKSAAKLAKARRAAKAAPAKPAPKKKQAAKPAPHKFVAAKPTAAKPLPVKTPAAKSPAVKPPTVKAPIVKPKFVPVVIETGFETGDFVVYPTHGVGRISGIENQEIAGFTLTLLIIQFEKEKMTLRVPTGKAKLAGLRKLSTRKVMESALKTLKGRSRVKRTMWSRRAQEYEAKINSGDPVSIAEVVRDLHRSSDQPDQSYSERQIYQAALDRLARELAAVEQIDEKQAAERLEQMLEAA
jgi:CarD family transcriptional regulator